GTFRRDLLYRLNAIEIKVPPLRDRPSDIAHLARAFLERAGVTARITPDALEALASYSWPGNVRELEHVMQRLAAGRPAHIERSHLPRTIRAAPSRTASKIPERAVPEVRPRANGGDTRQRRTPTARGERSAEEERAEIRAALSEAGGNISHAAERLGIT